MSLVDGPNCRNSAGGGPAPKRVTPEAVILRFALTSSGASGATSCHTETTSKAAETGQVSKNRTVGGAGTGAKTKDVTTPNCPPPAPRKAQNRSGELSSEAVTIRPSESTTS